MTLQSQNPTSQAPLTPICEQLQRCPQCCERYEPLFGKHTCRQPQARPVAYLYTVVGKWRVVCPSCGLPKNAREVPLFPSNLGQYQQSCTVCGVEVNPNANKLWPELFS